MKRESKKAEECHSLKVSIKRELLEDVLYMAEKYARKTPATTSVIFDRKTGEVEREVNYRKTIEDVQAVLDEEKKGAHWIGLKYDTARCSRCGNDIDTGFDSTAEAKEKWGDLYPFCPYCGAAMGRSEYNG